MYAFLIRSSILALVAIATVGCGSDNTNPDGPGEGAAGSGGEGGGEAGAGGGGGEDAEPSTGLTLFDYPLAVGVSDDGRLAVFQDLTSTEATAVLYDTHTGDVLERLPLGEPSRVLATAVSANGRLTAMHGDPLRAGIWSAGDGWIDIESPYAEGCGPDVGAAFDIGANGKVVVGLMWNGCTAEAFRWTDANGTPVYTKLETLGQAPEGSSNPPTNRATKVSADGRITAGFAANGSADRSPAVWDETGTGFLLVPDEVETPGEVLSIDGTGTTLAGTLGNDGFVWTREAGFTWLERFPEAMPSDTVYPNAITADGTTVFGGVGNAFFSLPTAFVWTSKDGMRPLLAVATDAGIEAPEGLMFQSVLGASADGTVLVGTALDAEGLPKTFLLRLPASL